MSTKTDDRLETMRARIDELQARAQAARAGAREPMKGQVDSLRQHEASARAALREARDAKAREVDEHTEAAEAKLEQLNDAADAKVQQLETRLKSAGHALDAELAENKQAFADAMQAYLDDFKEYCAQLDAKARTMAGGAREHAAAAISDIRQSRDMVAERLAQLREESGERWRERRESVAAARAELERKADEALKKLK